MTPTREDFIATCDSRVKLVRVEYGYTQEHMAYMLGLSKKTLVDIEKGRRTLGWNGAVTLCFVFQESEVISGTFGGMPADMILALAFDGKVFRHRQVIGLPVWWTTVMENDRYIIQQNLVSQHYRLITKDKTRVASAFDLDDLLPTYHYQGEGV